jgi:integrase
MAGGRMGQPRSRVHERDRRTGQPGHLTRWTKQQATHVGVPPLTPHDAARHGWATLALTAGVPPKVVQERLGHSSISITMDRYSHVIEGMDRAAAEAVAALIEQSSG